MSNVIPLHQYQYKYIKKLEIKKASKNIKAKKNINKKINDISHPVKYLNDLPNQKNDEKYKINLTKNIGNTDYKRIGQKNNYIKNYYNNIYKKQALFRNENQNIKLKKEFTSKNNTNKIKRLENNDFLINNENTKTEIKINNIINNDYTNNKVSDFNFNEKLSYSEKNKLRSNKYSEENLNNKINNIYISNSNLNNLNNNSSFQCKSSSGHKLNLSYLDFIKDFKSKYSEDINLKNKKKRTYVPFLSKFVNNSKSNPQISGILTSNIIESLSKEKQNNEIILNIKKELELKNYKIKELSEVIENQNNDYIQLNNKYKEILLENQKLKEEISNLKKEMNAKEKNITNINDSDLNGNIINETQKFKNMITYNINKNNNFNIINSEINNFNNIIQNKEKKKNIENTKDNNKENLDKVNEEKINRALERIKKQNNKKQSEFKKSNKIKEMAKMLEKQMKGLQENENFR